MGASKCQRTKRAETRTKEKRTAIVLTSQGQLGAVGSAGGVSKTAPDSKYPRLPSATTTTYRTRSRSFELFGVGHGKFKARDMKNSIVRGPWAILHAGIWTKLIPSESTWHDPAAPSECHHEAVSHPFSLIQFCRSRP